MRCVDCFLLTLLTTPYWPSVCSPWMKKILLPYPRPQLSSHACPTPAFPESVCPDFTGLPLLQPSPHAHSQITGSTMAVPFPCTFFELKMLFLFVCLLSVYMLIPESAPCVLPVSKTQLGYSDVIPEFHLRNSQSCLICSVKTKE